MPAGRDVKDRCRTSMNRRPAISRYRGQESKQGSAYPGKVGGIGNCGPVHHTPGDLLRPLARPVLA
jgi:hypothetical protein